MVSWIDKEDEEDEEHQPFRNLGISPGMISIHGLGPLHAAASSLRRIVINY